MFVVNSLTVAIAFCVLTMLGWGSWANTQKLAGKEKWPFELFYWDYFFGIVIAIQQRAGGNLAEALGNLSRVLRDRKKMKAKIRAMSQEAKASAGIIGALPIAVMIMVYISSPTYISLLWTESLGRLMLAGSALWMLAGVLVMKKMINFDF